VPAQIEIGNTDKSNLNHKVRRWFFTWNNYPEFWETMLKGLDPKEYVFGKETGTSGTPHIQGRIEFKNARSGWALHKAIPAIHWEKENNKIASEAYCKKRGIIVVVSLSENQHAPKQGLLQ